MERGIQGLIERFKDRLVFIRLREELPIERRETTASFTLPAGTPLPLTPLGAQALREDPRVFPLPALIQGLLLLLETEELLGRGFEPLPLYREFARTMAPDVLRLAEDELRRAVREEDWPLARARAAFLLNVSEEGTGPGPARLWAALGIASGRQGDRALGAERLERAVSMDPSLHEAYAELGVCYGKLGRHREAKEALLRAKEGLADLAVLFNLAQTCRLLGELKEARGRLAEARRLAPRDPRVEELARLLAERD